MRSSYIAALSYCIPDENLSHAELQDRFGADKMDRLVESTDIHNRRVCKSEEIASDLAYKAAKKILDSGDFDPNSIDLIIVATQMPDYLLPTTACILQHRLGLKKECGAFDINLGCSQFVYAHSVGHAMISAGLAERALVITCDCPSKIIDPQDATVVPLFGDGATATILEATQKADGYKDFLLGSDGSEHQSLIWRGSGLRDLFHQEARQTIAQASDGSFDRMTMDGQKIFLFTLQTVPRQIKKLLDKHEISSSDISFFALHQASGLIVSSVARKLKLVDDQFNRIYKNYGNSGGSTVGISLWHAIDDGLLKTGDLMVLSAFGVGLSWANGLYQIGAELPKLY